MYKNTLTNIDDKLKELKLLLHKKAQIEYKNSEKVDFDDPDLQSKVKKVNYRV